VAATWSSEMKNRIKLYYSLLSHCIIHGYMLVYAMLLYYVAGAGGDPGKDISNVFRKAPRRA
jgi:hypothetical protein